MARPQTRPFDIDAFLQEVATKSLPDQREALSGQLARMSDQHALDKRALVELRRIQRETGIPRDMEYSRIESRCRVRGQRMHRLQSHLQHVRSALYQRNEERRQREQPSFERHFMLTTKQELGPKIYERLLEATRKRLEQEGLNASACTTGGATNAASSQVSGGLAPAATESTRPE